MQEQYTFLKMVDSQMHAYDKRFYIAELVDLVGCFRDSSLVKGRPVCPRAELDYFHLVMYGSIGVQKNKVY